MYSDLKKRLIAEYNKLALAGADFSSDGIISVKDSKLNCYASKRAEADIKNITESDIVIIDATDNVVEGDKEIDPRFRAHKVIFECNENITAIVQPESRWNSIWAQSGETLPPLSAYHAKNFFGEIYSTGAVTFAPDEDYYQRMGECVLNRLKYKGVRDDGAAFIRNHSAVVWGTDLLKTVSKSIALEEICFRTFMTRTMVGGSQSYIPYEVNEKLYK